MARGFVTICWEFVVCLGENLESMCYVCIHTYILEDATIQLDTVFYSLHTRVHIKCTYIQGTMM